MKSIVITSENGLHARPASLIVNACSAFSSDIFLVKDGNKANARSIMNIMAMGIVKGDELKIEAEGDDAEAAEVKILEIIEASI
ncbi:HPr family phosphocarrier protein [Acidaminobacter sp. JC074]|uniref:HPr family phosphocarrier protein n=1 Tax=Acidaminobacter sp. JC074 TaxID=2530199 RepID=UPI001F0EEE8E|nr:HPr family phosphocarrier protein [Acidaminobacter sp. JC074]MCH4888769.1 HPr family phosphocarrier protein [Acidaminobacter sp. JC074]